MLFIPQKMHDECGLACLLMLLLHQGYSFEYLTLSDFGKFSTFYDITHFFRAYHIPYKMYYCYDINQIIYPSIGVLNFKHRKHFVVIWKSANQQVYYSDPANLKLKRKKIHRFSKNLGNEYITISKVNMIPYLEDNWYLPYTIKFFLLIFFFCFLLYKILDIFGII